MTSAPTAPLNFWDNKFWHHRVHQRLGETLHYYLVRVRPLDSGEVLERLDKLLNDHRLGGIRVFPIFGSYDFIIRAWLHPLVVTNFRAWLEASLAQVGSSHSVHPFSVEQIEKRWHGITDVDRDLLDNIEEDTIRDVQLGKNLSLLEKLMDGKLILTRRKTHNINFFIAINVEEGADLIHDGVVAGIKNYLIENPGVMNVSIYRGYGFCQLLVKAEVEGYLNIAPLPNWIGQAFKPFRAHTETYLAHGPAAVGSEAIHDATFLALRGRDLFVQAVIPELYDLHSDKRVPVERLLSEDAHKYPLTQKDKKILHEYLLAYLQGEQTEMAKTLFTIFFELEGYLRKHNKEFVTRLTQAPFKEIYQKVHIEEANWDRPTLKDLLHIYSQTIKQTDHTGQNTILVGGWEDLAVLRNDIAHAKVEILPNWDSLIKRLIPFLPRIRHLLQLIEAVTEKPYTGV